MVSRSKMMRLSWLWFLLALLVPLPAEANRERPWRTVVLLDGTVYTGQYEELIDGRVRLVSKDAEYVFGPDQVDAVYALTAPKEAGYAAQAGDFELGLTSGFFVSAGATQFEDAQWRLRMLGGYQIASLFQLGFEAGVNTDFRSQGFTQTDIAATGTLHFGRSPIGYFRAIAGVQVATYGGGIGVGPLFGAAAGVKVPLSRTGALLAGVNYAWSSQSLEAKRILLGQPTTDVSLSTHRVGLELGWLVYF